MSDELKQLKKRVPAYQIAAKYIDGIRPEGNDFINLCPFHEERTPSFRWNLVDGEWLWKCFGCGEGGDIIKFIEMKEGISTAEAIKKFKETVAPHSEWQNKTQQVADTFKPLGERVVEKKSTMPLQRYLGVTVRALVNSKEAVAWLEEKRGIGIETAKKVHFGFQQKLLPTSNLANDEESARDKGWIVFPRILGDKVVGMKYRSIATKAFSQEANMEDPSILFNLETINPLEPVFVTEGEFDTAILEQAGYRAVSIASASTKVKPSMKKKLKDAECIFLAGDNDGSVGNDAMTKLRRELGAKTFLITWPDAKDANEYFLKICKSDMAVFRTGLEALMEKAKATPVEGFTSVIDRLTASHGMDAKNDPYRLHFPSNMGRADDMNYTPAGKVVVFYSTYSATGKSVLMTQLALHEAKRGEVVVVYSPEITDDPYLAVLASQTVGPEKTGGLPRDGKITRDDLLNTARKLNVTTERETDFQFYVGHSLPVEEADDILPFFQHTIEVMGATRCVIDTLNRIVVPKKYESYVEAEGRTVKALEKIGLATGCIIILVGQSNKEAEGIKESNRDEYGVLRGSKEISDVAYGVYLIHRKRKQRKEGEVLSDILENDTELVLRKDRGRGPGPAQVQLLFKKEWSLFVTRDTVHQDVPPEAFKGESAYDRF